MTRPDFGPAETPPAPADPVEAWLTRARCCGAPQLCGARCMDDEESATEAAVVRRLDEAEARVPELVAHLQQHRRELLVALRANVSGGADYWRWQGHAELSRQLLTRLGAEVPQ